MALNSILRAHTIPGRLANAWARIVESRESEVAPQDVVEKALVEAPVIWLLGKVQTGKSSIVQAITGATEAEVGSGFRPCTRTARIFDFPAEAPVLRFLDTRGLGEVGYDPREDLKVSEGRAHLLLVVARAMDHQQQAILDAVSEVRRRRPDWPIVVAQTCLHDAYRPGDGHAQPYPYGDTQAPLPSSVPEALSRSLAHQREIFAAVRGSGPMLFVPIDFTRADDGFEPRLYGLDALLAAIGEAAPHRIGSMVGEIRTSTRERAARRANPLILGHAAAAAAADVVPLAGAVAVPGIQARLLHTLAGQRGIAWDRRSLTEFGGCLGASILTRLAAGFGIRQLAKLVPVYGQTVGSAAAAATSFATTYALGKAALVFLARREHGEREDPAEVSKAYRDALEKAFWLARERGIGADVPPETQKPAGAQSDAAG